MVAPGITPPAESTTTPESEAPVACACASAVTAPMDSIPASSRTRLWRIEVLLPGRRSRPTDTSLGWDLQAQGAICTNGREKRRHSVTERGPDATRNSLLASRTSPFAPSKKKAPAAVQPGPEMRGARGEERDARSEMRDAARDARRETRDARRETRDARCDARRETRDARRETRDARCE